MQGEVFRAVGTKTVDVGKILFRIREECERFYVVAGFAPESISVSHELFNLIQQHVTLGNATGAGAPTLFEIPLWPQYMLRGWSFHVGGKTVELYKEDFIKEREYMLGYSVPMPIPRTEETKNEQE